VDTGTRLQALLWPKVRLAGMRYARQENMKLLSSPDLQLLSTRTGGSYKYFQYQNDLEFAWAGYMLGIQIPATWDKPKEWELGIKNAKGKIDKNRLIFFPRKILPCGTATTAAR
jgi:hypothetical protein